MFNAGFTDDEDGQDKDTSKKKKKPKIQAKKPKTKKDKTEKAPTSRLCWDKIPEELKRWPHDKDEDRGEWVRCQHPSCMKKRPGGVKIKQKGYFAFRWLRLQGHINTVDHMLAQHKCDLHRQQCAV